MTTHFLGKKLCVISCNFRSAEIELRTRLALSRDLLNEIYKQNKFPQVEEILILSTCNRLELYTVNAIDEDDPALASAKILENLRNVPASEILAQAEIFYNKNAVQHLFEVAAGIDSQMLGESEILGQLKQAYEIANKAGTTGRILNKIFQKSFQAAKWIRSNTGITRGQISIGNISVDLATRIFGELNHCSVFIIGVGDAGRKVAQAFYDRGAGMVTIASRNYEKTRAIAAEIGISACEFHSLTRQIERADIVVGCASVETELLTREELKALMQKRIGNPLFLIDLGIPKNFPTDIREMDNLWLYDLQDLANITNKNLEARRQEITKAKDEIIRRIELLNSTPLPN